MNTQRYIATTLWMLTSVAAQNPPGGLSCQAPSPIDLGGYSPFAALTEARPGSLARYFPYEAPGIGTQLLPPQTIGFRVPTGDANSRWVAADFDSNTLTDIGQIWNNNGRARISVRLTQLDGSVVSQTWLADAGPWVPSNVYLAGDYNNDGYNDIAVAWNEAGSVSITTFLSAGGSFYDAGKWVNRVGGWSDSVKWLVGDFNGDRLVDVMAVWNYQGGAVFAIRNSTGTSFGAPANQVSQHAWSNVHAVLPMNLNGDLLTDVAVITHIDYPAGPLTVSTFLRATPASFAYGNVSADLETYAVATGARWMAGDFNNDGRSDLMAVWTRNNWAGMHLLSWRDTQGLLTSVQSLAQYQHNNNASADPLGGRGFCPGVFQAP